MVIKRCGKVHLLGQSYTFRSGKYEDSLNSVRLLRKEHL